MVSSLNPPLLMIFVDNSSVFHQEINKTDKEIDRIVYELYGLIEEEILIVEGNVS